MPCGSASAVAAALERMNDKGVTESFKNKSQNSKAVAI